MSFARKNQSQKSSSQSSKWLSLPIGLRLSLAFMAVILLTGLIGIIAIQQISSLTNKATELYARDLPESTTLERLRTLLYRQDDLEHSLINGNILIPDQVPTSTESDTSGVTPGTSSNSVKSMQRDLTELATVLQEISKSSQQLLAFEQSEQGEDPTLARKVSDITLKARENSARIQTLVEQGQIAQARALDFNQQEPLLLSAVTAVTRLSSLEQTENANDTAQTQQDSQTSTLFLLALTVFCLLLSIVLAFLITRSLTKPLKALVQTTELISAGNLDVQPQVKRADEIGRLASAYDTMRMSLRSTIDRLSQERQHTQAIIDASADGIMLVDQDYKIVISNPAVELLSGWRSSEAIGRYCWEVLGYNESSIQAAQANEQLLPLMEALQARSETSSFEMLILTRSGKSRWLAISCASIDEPDTPHATVIGLHDISQLKAVDQMKSDFVAMVSHELRAPLTTVSGSVETLHLLEPSADSESYQEVLGLLDQQTQRLRQVVEEVLQLTRFEAGRLEVQVQQVSLKRFLRNLVQRTNGEWSESDHHITFREPAQEIKVWADAGLLEIVLRNVFENARKYTPQGTDVEVETEIITTTNQVQIRVIDNGPGIPDDQLESIFERFTRGTQQAGNWTRGYGLGLYIARELMQAQNGSITAERREHGACFVLSLWMTTDDVSSLTKEGTPANVGKQEKEHLA